MVKRKQKTNKLLPSSPFHYVLIGPKGKQAGHRNQRRLALQLLAQHLTVAKEGGGIVNELLPKTLKERDRLAKLISRGYKFKQVLIRKTMLPIIREAVMSDELIVKLAVRFEQERGHSKRAVSAVKR